MNYTEQTICDLIKGFHSERLTKINILYLDGIEYRMEDIFTDITISDEKNDDGQFVWDQIQSKSDKHVFLIKGKDGVGKSFYLDRMIDLWCKKEDLHDAFIPFIFKEKHNQRYWSERLDDFLAEVTKDFNGAEDYFRYETNLQRKKILFLDNAQSCLAQPIIQRIRENKFWADKVIIFKRGCTVNNINDICDSCMEIKGFSQNSLQIFFKRLLREKTYNIAFVHISNPRGIESSEYCALKLIDNLQQNPILYNKCLIPLFAVLLQYLWMRCTDFNELKDIGEIYEHILDLDFGEDETTIRKIGKTAFRNIFYNQPEALPYRYINNRNQRKMLEMHCIYEEYFAAKYISMQQNEIDMKDNIQEEDIDCIQKANIFRFLRTINPQIYLNMCQIYPIILKKTTDIADEILKIIEMKNEICSLHNLRIPPQAIHFLFQLDSQIVEIYFSNVTFDFEHFVDERLPNLKHISVIEGLRKPIFLKDLLIFLKTHPQLETVEIEGNYIEKESLDNELDLKVKMELLKLSLVNCNLQKRELEIIIKWLKSCPYLKTLNLSMNTIRDGIMTEFVSCINSNKYNKLTEIYFDDCTITSMGISNLSECLKRLEKLQVLSLSKNSIESKGMVYLYHAIGKCTSLTELYLSQCSITDLDTRIPFESRSLKKLYLSGNNIKSLLGNKSIRYQYNNLTHLELTACHFLRENIKEDTAIFPSTIVYLNLSDSVFCNEFGSIMTGKISELSKLKNLQLENCQLDDNLEFLRELKNLEILNLSRNEIGITGYESLSNMRSLSMNLIHLSLEDCFLEGTIRLDLDDTFANLQGINLSKNGLACIQFQTTKDHWPKEIILRDYFKSRRESIHETIIRIINIQVLTILDISSNALNGEMENILNLISNNSNLLEELYIYNNGLKKSLLLTIESCISKLVNLKVLNCKKNSTFFSSDKSKNFAYIKLVQFIDYDIFNLSALREIISIIDFTLKFNILDINEDATPSKYLKYFLEILQNKEFEIWSVNIQNIVLNDEHLELLSKVSYSKGLHHSLSILDVIFFNCWNNISFMKTMENIKTLRLYRLTFIPQQFTSSSWNAILETIHEGGLKLKTLSISYGCIDVTHNLSKVIQNSKDCLSILFLDKSTVGFKVLSKIGEYCSNIQELSFWKSTLDLQGNQDSFLKIFEKNTKIKYLELGKCKTCNEIDQIGRCLNTENLNCESIFPIISRPGSVIEKLGLRKQEEINNKTFCDMLKSIPSLRTLDIAFCTFGNTNRLFQSEEINPKLLEKLGLRSLRISPEGFDNLEICKVLVNCSNLTSFSISENKIGDEVCKLLLLSLNERQSQLRELYLYDNNLMPGEDSYLVEFLMKLDKIEVINIMKNDFSVFSKEIIDCLSKKKSLLHIELRDIKLSCLDQPLKYLEDSFNRNKNLKFLDLSENELFDEYGEVLLNGLCKNNRKLEVLKLSQCDFTSSITNSLITSLKYFEYLQIFDISENKLNGRSGEKILTVLHKFSKHISEIYMMECNLNDTILNGITNYLSKPKKLTLLDLSGNSELSDEFWKFLNKQLNNQHLIMFNILFDGENVPKYWLKIKDKMSRRFPDTSNYSSDRSNISCFSEGNNN
ncbi:DgyrCDS3195 [Dimorphilus gyrociliatus]|uniref:DgyrCDS3195 n=1 Tax=Dimorphilus gyrociliatus TaxID=2664684 RepID=A0A7I8VED3_9ANNE|nr:DgyrCDS3195 [Dimorphilus gyrociliatus]